MITGVNLCLITKITLKSLFCCIMLGNTSTNHECDINENASFKRTHILFNKQSACRSVSVRLNEEVLENQEEIQIESGRMNQRPTNLRALAGR